MNQLVVSFGETMLRLAPPGFERFLQSPRFVATFGGGEANVAVALAGFGNPARYITVLPPNNPIADALIGELRAFGVDASNVCRGPGRMGIYFVEAGPTSGRPRWSTTAKIAPSRWPNPAPSTGGRHSTARMVPYHRHHAGLEPERGRPRAGKPKGRASRGNHGFLRPEFPQESLEVRQDGATGDE